MAEARQLKAGRWRIYLGGSGVPVRYPASGAIATFDSLAQARRWWRDLHPDDPPLQESPKCAQCGAYFGPSMGRVPYAGRWFHQVHAPSAITNGRGFHLG